MSNLSVTETPPIVNVDRFLAGYYGKKVRFWLFDEDTGEPRLTPLKEDSTIEFHARLAASYGRRALDGAAHQSEVDRGWLAVKVLLGEVGSGSR